jgi:hypothetical protein
LLKLLLTLFQQRKPLLLVDKVAAKLIPTPKTATPPKVTPPKVDAPDAKPTYVPPKFTPPKPPTSGGGGVAPRTPTPAGPSSGRGGFYIPPSAGSTATVKTPPVVLRPAAPAKPSTPNLGQQFFNKVEDFFTPGPAKATAPTITKPKTVPKPATPQPGYPAPGRTPGFPEIKPVKPKSPDLPGAPGYPRPGTAPN